MGFAVDFYFSTLIGAFKILISIQLIFTGFGPWGQLARRLLPTQWHLQSSVKDFPDFLIHVPRGGGGRGMKEIFAFSKLLLSSFWIYDICQDIDYSRPKGGTDLSLL